ncbi:MAG: non-hydrolyzing UDP-N-acetylglucosamine 2-epimerase [Mangrovibacterium sp.]
MKRVLLVFGTRPEAIKMAPLVQEFRRYFKDFKTFVCVTGQHREMLDQVLSLFQIEPDYDLNIMQQDQDLYEITTRILLGVRDILYEIHPDVVFVHGDTTTSTIAALAAFYQKIPVAHVEAGLRTNNRYSPWPEEMNRSITGRIASYHFAPTNLAKENLLMENVAEKDIIVTGNTVIDALDWVINKLKNDEALLALIKEEIFLKGYDVSRLRANRRMILITGHRRENLGDGFMQICHAIKNLALRYNHVDFVYPVHLNPQVRKPVNDILRDSMENVFLLEPLEYLQFVFLMDHAYLILTDSGGVQEEAPCLGKLVLVMRDTTERPEVVDAGMVKLVGADREKIEKEVASILDKNRLENKLVFANNPYGDGQASERIVTYCKNKLK